MSGKLLSFVVVFLFLTSCGHKKEASDSKYTSNETSYLDEKKAGNFMLDKSYSTQYYTIQYPSEWSILEQVNEITDVYIGSEQYALGFTIVRFETDYSLSQVNSEGNRNVRQSGIKVSDDKLITLDGVDCYRALHEISIGNQTLKQISYTFKKGYMLYNIKFGSVITKEQEELVAAIINSFQFK